MSDRENNKFVKGEIERILNSIEKMEKVEMDSITEIKELSPDRRMFDCNYSCVCGIVYSYNNQINSTEFSQAKKDEQNRRLRIFKKVLADLLEMINLVED